jgi:hypothetical protein
MNKRAALMLVSALTLGAALAACVGGSSPTRSGAPSQPPSPSSAAGDGFALNAAPADLGCDAMRPPYEEVTFRIAADANDPVTAVADTGAELKTYWSAGFVGGTVDDPVVRDAKGHVVVSDGDTLAMPEADWPRLAGYFVCPSTNALYVLEVDPS